MRKFWPAGAQSRQGSGTDERPIGMQALINAIPEAIVVLDSSQRIVHLNSAAQRLFGCRAADVKGAGFGVLVAAAPANGGEGLGRRAGADLFPIDISTLPLGALTVATIRDISERKREEAERLALGQQFIQAQKKEALGIMAEWVAHDMGNILNGMLACNEFVRDHLPAGDPAEQILDSAMRAGLRGRDVVGQMLAFGRAEIAQPGPVDLLQVVRDASALLPCSGGNGLRLVIEADARVPAVMGCAAQFFQVVVNLFVNAVQATARAGELRVSLTQVAAEDVPAAIGQVEQDGEDWRLGLGTPASGPLVRLRVADTGCGMAPETLAHIFEPFFTTKVDQQGSGLGLSAVLGIVSQAGGAISVRTRLGHGSCFDILLPVAKP